MAAELLSTSITCKRASRVGSRICLTLSTKPLQALCPQRHQLQMRGFAPSPLYYLYEMTTLYYVGYTVTIST